MGTKKVTTGFYIVDKEGRLWFGSWSKYDPAITSQGYTIVQVNSDGTWEEVKYV